MKTILSALIALCFITGVVGPVVALDAKSFYEQVDRNHYAKAIAAFCCEPSNCVFRQGRLDGVGRSRARAG
jgi:hypothetical protein